MTGEHRHAHTGSTDGEVRNAEDLAAFAPQLLVLVGLAGSVIDQGTGQWNYVEGNRGDVVVRRREFQRAAVVHELLNTVDHGAGLVRQLLDTGQTAAGYGLIGRNHQANQLRLVVQRLQHRHRSHGGAVRVGDNALGQLYAAHIAVEVHLADHQRNIGILAPGRGVVDHYRTGGSEPRCLHPRHGGTGGKQCDIQTTRVSGLGVLDLDLLTAEGQLASLRAR